MSHQKRPVTLEDLLRLKRAEQPPAEFWEKFDQQLRAKQLSALVEKRPWWQKLSPALAGWRRYHLPLGATAVLAVTLLSVHDFQSGVVVPQIEAQAPGAATVSVPATATPTAEMAPAANLAELSSPSSSLLTAAEPAPSSPPENLASAALVVPGELSRVLTLGAAEPQAPVATEPTPSERFIAANFAAVQAGEPVLGQGLLTPAPHRVIARGTPVEPLAQMAGPVETPTRRMLTTSRIKELAMRMPAGPADRVTDRQARALSDEKLYESKGRRLSAGGNFVNIGL